MLCDGYFGIVYTFNLLFIHCCIYKRGEVSVNLVAVHAHARAPMASHAMAPCASAAELASVCMFQLNNIAKILKFRKDGTTGRWSVSSKETKGARQRGGAQAEERVHCVSSSSVISYVQNC